MNWKTPSKQMTSKHNRIITSCWICMLLLILAIISDCCVESLQILDKFSFGPKPEGTIKTIEVLDDGDMIDCVLIYKQPAFNNPLLKGLIKINPIFYPSVFNKTKDSQRKIRQAWNKFGECPDGTIPIRRTMNNNDTFYPKTSNAAIHEYATVIHTANNIKGGRARLNVWDPRVITMGEFSLSQIWVVSGSRAELNSIEAGWVVYPEKYRNSEPRFFIYYTPDGYKTKCWDLDCGGFVQLDRQFVLGKALELVSVYDGEQIDTLVSISRDNDVNGHWWLKVDDTIVGFWHHRVFTTLRDSANSVAFGGEIVNQNRMRLHTATGMGSGHYSHEGYKKACYTSNIEIVNDAYEWVEPHLQLQTMTRPECYDLKAGPLLTNMGSHFYFGGPGLNAQCR